MLKRKIYDDLLHWKSRNDKQCLVVKGARQVGKSFIIELFARENYKYYKTLDFEKNPAYRVIFDGDLDINTIIKQISLRVPEVELIPGETLLFFDEIQSCPRARTALKFLTQDGRFDVIASGSLLGINYKEVSSYPLDMSNTLRCTLSILRNFYGQTALSQAQSPTLKSVSIRR